MNIPRNLYLNLVFVKFTMQRLYWNRKWTPFTGAEGLLSCRHRTQSWVSSHLWTLSHRSFCFLLVRWDFGYCGHYWPIAPAPDDRWWWLWRNWWNEDWLGKLKYSEKTCPSATLSIRNPTWLDPSLNLGRRGGKPATNRLSCGAALTS
jgi:hypothetical protein